MKTIINRDMYLTRDGCGNYALHLEKPKFINRYDGFWTAKKCTWLERMCPDTKRFFGLKKHLSRGIRGIVKIHIKMQGEIIDEKT